MTENFAHLHLHTQYSPLDGAIRLKDLFPAVLERGMDTVAMTDHENMCGAVEFFEQAKAHGVRPILGCEVLVADRGMGEGAVPSGYHLVLLARDAQGYKNLLYLVSMASLRGSHGSSGLSLGMLEERSAGLVGLSACLSGQVAQTILNEGVEAAKEVARGYRGIFDPGMFFLELQSNGLEVQEEVNEGLIRIARALEIPLVATNDCHYVDRKDAFAHEVLMCIEQGKSLQDESRIRLATDELYIKTPAEMEAAFAHVPEALENAGRIARMCKVELELGHRYQPPFQPPGGVKPHDYLVQVAREGLESRFREIATKDRYIDESDEDDYQARLQAELEVIREMGVSGSFLVVWDFVRHARSKGIAVGPGRGSMGGSLVAYSIGITDLDSIEHGLVFEQFINQERGFMGDFGVEFDANRHEEVLAYLVEKYGKDHVAHIARPSISRGRGLVRSVASALAVSPAETDALSKLIPVDFRVDIQSALENEKRLKKAYEGNEVYRNILDLATKLEGCRGQPGIREWEVVIADKPLWEYVPCSRGQDDDVIQTVTQFSTQDVKKTGLEAFLVLRQSTSTIPNETVARINETRVPYGLGLLFLETLPLDDPDVYAMLQRGEWSGPVATGSSQFSAILRRLRPDRFSDLAAALALYRPRPLSLGMLEDFISAKQGLRAVSHPHPALDEILAETYGTIVYNEQIIRIASTVAGFSLGQADIMYRAMAKHSAELHEEQRVAFLEGAKRRGVDREVAEEVFALIERFAPYSFSKSHSVSMAMIAYHTTYLKCHYPEEYAATLLSFGQDDADKRAEHITMVENMGVSVLAPDINESDQHSIVVRGSDGKRAVRFGLGAVAGVGSVAAESILRAREDGPFVSLSDLIRRVDLDEAHRGAFEALIKAGALDGLAEKEGVCRARMMAGLEVAIDRAKPGPDRMTGEMEPSGALPVEQVAPKFEYPDIRCWSQIEQLRYERQTLGFYASSHPLDVYAKEREHFATHDTQAVSMLDIHPREIDPFATHDMLDDSTLDIHAGEMEPLTTFDTQGASMAVSEGSETGVQVAIAGMAVGYETHRRTGGDGRYAIFELSDRKGKLRVFVPPHAFAAVDAIMPASDEPVLVRGRVRRVRTMDHYGWVIGLDDEASMSLFAEEVILLSDLRQDPEP